MPNVPARMKRITTKSASSRFYLLISVSLAVLIVEPSTPPSWPANWWQQSKIGSEFPERRHSFYVEVLVETNDHLPWKGDVNIYLELSIV